MGRKAIQRIILIAFLSFCSARGFSQGMYGFQAGVGLATAYHPSLTPAFEGYYLRRLSQRFYVGGSLFFQKYSFLYGYNFSAANANYGDAFSLRQKSAYLFFSPKIDFGVGYRKYVHLQASFGPGVYMGGHQYTNEYRPPTWTVLPSGYGLGQDITAVNTSYNIPDIIFRYAAGIVERIPTLGYWNITLSQEISVIPGHISKDGNFQTNYISFQVGIMHKYRQVFVEY